MMSTSTASTPSSRRPQLGSKNKTCGWGWPRLIGRSAASSSISQKGTSRSRSDSDPAPRITVEVFTKPRALPEDVSEAEGDDGFDHEMRADSRQSHDDRVEEGQINVATPSNDIERKETCIEAHCTEVAHATQSGVPTVDKVEEEPVNAKMTNLIEKEESSVKEGDVVKDDNARLLKSPSMPEAVKDTDNAVVDETLGPHKETEQAKSVEGVNDPANEEQTRELQPDNTVVDDTSGLGQHIEQQKPVEGANDSVKEEQTRELQPDNTGVDETPGLHQDIKQAKSIEGVNDAVDKEQTRELQPDNTGVDETPGLHQNIEQQKPVEGVNDPVNEEQTRELQPDTLDQVSKEVDNDKGLGPTDNADAVSDVTTIREVEAEKQEDVRGPRDKSDKVVMADEPETAKGLGATLEPMKSTQLETIHTDNEADDEAAESSSDASSEAEILEAHTQPIPKQPKLIIRIPTSKLPASPTPYPQAATPTSSSPPSDTDHPPPATKTTAPQPDLSPIIELVSSDPPIDLHPTIELLPTTTPGEERPTYFDNPRPQAALPAPRIFLTRASESTTPAPFPTPSLPTPASYTSTSPLPSEIQKLLQSDSTHPSPSPTAGTPPPTDTGTDTPLINEAFGAVDVPLQAKKQVKVKRRKRFVRKTRKAVLRTPVLKVLLGRGLARGTRVGLVRLAEGEEVMEMEMENVEGLMETGEMAKGKREKKVVFVGEGREELLGKTRPAVDAGAGTLA